MASRQNSAPKIRSTFFTSMFIISLVLFSLGIVCFGAIYTNRMVQMAQEEFAMMITLPDHAGEERRGKFQDFLTDASFTKRVEYVSKDDAARIFMESLGEDFLDITDGVNPLPPSFNVYLNGDYIYTDSFAKINKILADPDSEFAPLVKDVVYPIDDIEQMRRNFNRYVKIAGIVAILVALIAFFIVNSTIRLSIYAKRLMLRSMQLIGATNRFIRAPFVKLGLLQGFFGGILGVVFLVAVILVLEGFEVIQADTTSDFPIVGSLIGYGVELMVLLAGIIIFGAILGWISSRWAVNRFLNRNLDQII